MLAVRVALDGSVIADGQPDTRWFNLDLTPGDVVAEELAGLFASRFDALREVAFSEAQQRLETLAQDLRERRGRHADALLAYLKTDTVDRLAEIAELEGRARTPAEEATGQQRLALDGDDPPAGFDQRREIIRRQAETRRAEVEGFRHVGDSAPLVPLGALFLVPESA